MAEVDARWRFKTVGGFLGVQYSSYEIVWASKDKVVEVVMSRCPLTPSSHKCSVRVYQHMGLQMLGMRASSAYVCVEYERGFCEPVHQ